MGAYFNDLADATVLTPADVTSPATGVTGDVRGTVTPAAALNGSSFYMCEMKPRDASTQFGLFGVMPA